MWLFYFFISRMKTNKRKYRFQLYRNAFYLDCNRYAPAIHCSRHGTERQVLEVQLTIDIIDHHGKDRVRSWLNSSTHHHGFWKGDPNSIFGTCYFPEQEQETFHPPRFRLNHPHSPTFKSVRWFKFLNRWSMACTLARIKFILHRHLSFLCRRHIHSGRRHSFLLPRW